MKYMMIFHANLNYAYLTEDKYEFVIRSAYEMIFDTMREKFPNAKYVFEASGYTIEQIALKTPDVLQKLREAIERGQCEFMGSPYAHPMLPNFPKEDGIWSIKFANDIFKKYLDIQPQSFWNPECGWRHYVPEQVIANGYRNLIGDFEAYSRSLNKHGQPNRPDIYAAEHSDDPVFYNFAFNYDLPGSEKAIHFPFDKIAGVEKNQLNMFLRTDRVAQFAVRYFMGMPGYSFEEYMDLIKKYSEQNEGEEEGALIIFADDAEYVGTNGWFKLKYQNQPDNCFEATPESQEKLIKLVHAVSELGEFCTFDEACNNLPALDDELNFDDDAAWHGAMASFWAETPMAKLLRPWQQLVRDKLLSIEKKLDPVVTEKAWYYLTTSYNSDGQWPPTLPDAPHIIHPFNYQYCFEHLRAAELLIGGVDRARLQSSANETLKQILGIQQERILQKAKELINENPENTDAVLAKKLIEFSQTELAEDSPILQASEYTVRANALVEARQLVGGIFLENPV